MPRLSMIGGHVMLCTYLVLTSGAALFPLLLHTSVSAVAARRRAGTSLNTDEFQTHDLYGGSRASLYPCRRDSWEPPDALNTHTYSAIRRHGLQTALCTSRRACGECSYHTHLSDNWKRCTGSSCPTGGRRQLVTKTMHTYQCPQPSRRPATVRSLSAASPNTADSHTFPNTADQTC